MNFARTENLAMLALIPILFFVMYLASRRFQQRLIKVFGERLREVSLGRWSKSRYFLKMSFYLLGVSFVVVSLARPRLGYHWQEIPSGGLDIIVALDVSKSMDAEDLKPSRLERAKREVLDLIGMLQGDRIGLIAFAGMPSLQCPLTSDYELAKIYVNQLDTDLLSLGGTSIGDALRVAAGSFDAAQQTEETKKAIILITDGEDHSNDTLDIVRELKKKGVLIYAIGVGNEEGAPIPIEGQGYKKDPRGNVVLSKLDESTLVEIARISGGTYVRSSAGDFDLDHIYTQGIRKKVSEVDYGVKRQKVWHEWYQYPLFLGFLFLLLDAFIGTVERKKVFPILLVALWLSFDNPNLSANEVPNLKGSMEAFQNGSFDQAIRGFSQAELESPQDASITYNRSLAQYKNGEFQEALRGFEAASRSIDPSIRGNSLFNIGNTQVALGELEKAIEAYDKRLELGEDPKTQENRKWVLDQIEKKKQQQKSKNQESSQKDQKSEDSQDSKDQKNDRSQQKNQGDDSKKDDQSDSQKDSTENKVQSNSEEDSDQNSENQEAEQNKPSNPQDDPEKNGSKREENEPENKGQDSSRDQKTAQRGNSSNEEEGQSMPDGEDTDKMAEELEKKAQNSKPGEKQQSQQMMSIDPKKMSKEEAEKILKMIRSYDGRIGLRPERPKNQNRQEQDW